MDSKRVKQKLINQIAQLNEQELDAVLCLLDSLSRVTSGNDGVHEAINDSQVSIAKL